MSILHNRRFLYFLRFLIKENSGTSIFYIVSAFLAVFSVPQLLGIVDELGTCPSFFRQ